MQKRRLLNKKNLIIIIFSSSAPSKERNIMTQKTKEKIYLRKWTALTINLTNNKIILPTNLAPASRKNMVFLWDLTTLSYTDNFRVPRTLAFKARLSAKPCCENEFYLHENKKIIKIICFKVARYSFSGSIPAKFEHKLRRHKQSFGKIATTVVLDKDENLLWSGLQRHQSCHSVLPILLAAVYLGTGNCSSKIVHGSFFLQ